MKYILLVPHPDDELIHMCRWFLESNSVCILITDTEKSRLIKFKKLMKEFNKQYLCLGLKESWILSYDKNYIADTLVKNCEDIFNGSPFRSIVSPSPLDSHPEHVLIASIAPLVAHKLRSELIYSSLNRPTMNFRATELDIPDKVINIKKYYGEEYAALQASSYNITNKEYSIKLYP